MAEFIKKITFKYTKKDGEESTRSILAPKFLKESYNSFKELDKEQVKYVSGFEVQKDGLTEEEIKEYEESVVDYFTLALPTMEEYLKDLGLDPEKVKRKHFKKDGISRPNIIKENE
jgi:hypothetical protein